MKTKSLPSLSFEKELWQQDYIVIGIDEVGRGAFAGPLVVGGVALKPCLTVDDQRYIESQGINDCKKLLPAVRKKLVPIIKDLSREYFCAKISLSTINRVGIGQATEIGMRSVVKEIQKNIPEKKIFLLIDAFTVKNIPGVGIANQKGIVRGDSLSLSIAAASVIAKVYRDELMEQLSTKYPQYLWDKNKGYGTIEHRKAIQTYGPCKLHRMEFIKNVNSTQILKVKCQNYSLKLKIL